MSWPFGIEEALERVEWAIESLAARLVTVTTLALLTLAGVWLVDDDTKLQMAIFVVIVWLAGTIDCIYWSRSHRFSQAVLHVLILTALASIAFSGVWHPRSSTPWQPWLVTSGVVLGVAFVFEWFIGHYGSPVTARLWDLGLLSGLATGAIAGLWFLDDHTEWLPLAVAGLWLVYVIRAVHSHYIWNRGRHLW